MYGVMDKVICFDICRILSLCGITVVTSTKKVLCHFFNFYTYQKTMMLIIQNLRIQLYIDYH